MRRKITDVIERWADSDNGKVLVIRGSRQVGKTYSVREFGRRRFGQNFLEINFKDNPGAYDAFEGNLSVDDLIVKLNAVFPDFNFVPGKTLIFIDEIQNCPQARTALKPLAIDGRYKVIASGSLLGIRMKEFRLHPMGYLKRVDMYPMDFEEFLWALNMPQSAIDAVKKSILEMKPIEKSLFEVFSELYFRYMAIGGMPEVVNRFVETKMISDLRGLFNELIDGYVEDISMYSDGSTKVIAKACLDSMPAMLTSENKKFMYSKVGIKVGESSKSSDQNDDFFEIKEGSKSSGFRYFSPALDWLSMAHISLTCNNISEPMRPLEERLRLTSFKLYMLDTGVLVSRYEPSVFTEIFLGRPDANLGTIAENAVAQAFASQGRRLMYLSKDSPRMEIDFVTVIGGKVCCIEVKSGENRRCRSLNRVMEQYGTMGIMFETRNIFVDDKGVRHYPLFAASFMDAIDPQTEIAVDMSGIEKIREMYGS